MASWLTVAKLLNRLRSESKGRHGETDSATFLVSQRFAEVLATDFSLVPLRELRDAYREMITVVEDDRLSGQYKGIERFVMAWECIYGQPSIAPKEMDLILKGETGITLMEIASYIAIAYARFSKEARTQESGFEALPRLRAAVEKCANSGHLSDSLAKIHVHFVNELFLIEGRSLVEQPPISPTNIASVDNHNIDSGFHSIDELIEEVCVAQLKHFRSGVMGTISSASPEALRRHVNRSFALLWISSVLFAVGMAATTRWELFIGLVGPAIQWFLADGWGIQHRFFLRVFSYLVLVSGIIYFLLNYFDFLGK